MPAGLDGHPEPISTLAREAVLGAVGSAVARVHKDRVLVAVDGAPGVGKSTFADELARWLTSSGRAVIRSTTDSFHRPRSERYRRGPTSPEGYYLDSHDLATIERELLEPFTDREPRVMVAAFDEPLDTPAVFHVDVGEQAVLVFDGLFLLRDQLRNYWDVTVHLEADQRREAAWNGYLHDGLPEDAIARAEEIDRRLEHARWPRYDRGWQLYLDEVQPERLADFVIDNDDLANPHST